MMITLLQLLLSVSLTADVAPRESSVPVRVHSQSSEAAYHALAPGRELSFATQGPGKWTVEIRQRVSDANAQARGNVLVLDEPTNHLDIEGIEALSKGLLSFEGTLIFVSHNRWFVEKLATRVIELSADGVFDCNGTYAEYVAFLKSYRGRAYAVEVRA